MARRIIGLDIREDAIAAVSVKAGFRGNSIEAYVHVPVSESDDGMVLALERVAEYLDVGGAVCLTSIPASDASFRNLMLPFKQSKKIRQILPFELEQTLPISAEYLSIDFCRVSSDETGNESVIIAGAVDQSRLDIYLETLIPLGLRPERVTVGGYPSATLLARHSHFWENELVLNLGKRACTLFIVASGEVRFIRTFPVLATTSPHMSSIGSDILRTIAAFEEMLDTEFQPQGVLITDAESNDTGLIEEMSQQLEIPVQLVDITQEAKIQIKEDLRETWNPLLMNNALSLALAEIEGIAGFNFLRDSISEKRLWNEHGKRIVRSGILACLVAALAMFNLIYETYTVQKQVTRLDREMIKIFKETYPDVKRIVDPLHQMRMKIKSFKKDTLYSGAEGGVGSMRVIDMLNDISRLIPLSLDVDLTRIVTSPESITISGNTDTFNTVNDIRTRLQKVQRFQRVAINSANIEKSGNRVRFKLKIEL